jgi:hypothetical protein
MLNASPFYYGIGICAYQPLVDADTLPSNGFTKYVNGSTLEAGVNMLSQLPHIFYYPQNNQGGEMKLPYINYKNWLRVGQIQDFDQMGTITLLPLIPLENANGATGSVTIQIYAWADNIRVCAPTSQLALQSKDEYDTGGVVSGPASAIASATSALSHLPIIGRYMTAASYGASAISKIASLFGFTNTAVIDPVAPMKNVPYHAFASAEISTPLEKLTLDPKNELSIDPSIIGVSRHDDMDISRFVQREATLRPYTWDISDPVDTLICAFNVLPELILGRTADGIKYRNSTPIAHASKLFSYWRGDIIFRFRFICSKFHKGRVRITYDPEGNIIANTVTSSVCFTKIVDISDEVDVEVRIPYMQAIPWMRNPDTNFTEYYGDSTYAFNRLYGESNGMLTIRVFTDLLAPIDVAPVSIITSVRAADNFELAGPTDPPKFLSYFQPQSLDSHICDYEKPSHICASNDASSEDDPNRYLINHGEKVSSFRQLLRRFNLSRYSPLTADTTNRLYTGILFFPRKPLYYGFQNNGINTANKALSAGTAQFNYVFNTPYNWLAPCYLGERGSHRWAVNVAGPKDVASVRVARKLQTRIVSDFLQKKDYSTAGSNSGYCRYAVANLLPHSSGMALTNQSTQSGMVVSTPMYSQYRMQTTVPDYVNLGANIDGTDLDTVRAEISLYPSYDTGVVASTNVEFYHSIGADFSLLYLMYVPTLYEQTLPTAP